MENNYTLIITEISFKNKDHDFIKFKVLTKEDQVDLQGLNFTDDKTFKTIESSRPAKNNQEFILTFNSSEPDSENKLFTTHSGLTATTEQIILSREDKILDLGCWFKEPPAQAEISQFEKLQSQLGLPALTDSCFPGDQVKAGQNIFRIKPEISKNSWQLAHNESEAQNNNGSRSTNTTGSKSTTSNTSASITLPQSEIPTAQSPLKISEIFPNPAGTDSKKEWLEIINSGDKVININGYILDDGNEGSKPYLISKQPPLQPNQARLFNSTQTKLSLANKTDQVRLFSPDHQLIDQIEYQESRDDLSYAHVLIDDQATWQWTDLITPGQPNPALTSITGTIITPARFGDPSYFIVQTTTPLPSDNSSTVITFSETLIKAPLAQALFTKNSSGKFIGIIKPLQHTTPNFENAQQMELVSYELNPISDSEPGWSSWILPLVLIIGVILWKKKKSGPTGKQII